MSVLDSIAEKIRDTWLVERSSGLPHSALDEALLGRAQEQAAEAVREATSACHELGAGLAQQRAQLDTASDKSRLLVARAQDSRAHLRRTRDALERAKLTALNTALDGARLGEARGRALVLVAEEWGDAVRAGLSAVEDLEALFRELDQDRERLSTDLASARAKAADVSQELLRAQAAQRRADEAVKELGLKLSSVTGTDAESAKLLSNAAEHARGLLAALGALSEKPQRSLLWRALRPTLGPLARVLRDLERPSAGGEESR